MARKPPVDKRGSPKGAPHQPAYRPSRETRDEVKILASQGMSLRAIAACLRVSHETVRKHYAEEIEHGRAFGEKMVSKALYSGATSGDFQSQRFWLRSVAKWTEEHPPESADAADGGPVTRVLVEVMQPATWARNSGLAAQPDSVSESKTGNGETDQ